MKVLIDGLSARQGGGQTYLFNLLTRVPADQEVFLYAPPEVARKVAGPQVHVLEPDWPNTNALVRSGWEKLFLRTQARKLNADVLFFPGGVVACDAPDGCRTVTMFRNVIPFDPAARAKYPLGWQRLRNRLLERVMLKSMLGADLVIFLSDYARGLIEKRAACTLTHAVTIPHGVSAAFRHAAGARPAWVPAHPYLLYVSSFEHYKAQIEVVRAFARVRKEWAQPLSLVLVGPDNTSYAQRVRAEIVRLGIADAVRIPGIRPYDELPAAYHHACAVVFASEAENCPNALLEAMAAGKAIACSRRPPMPEFGADAVAYFDPADDAELVELLLRLLREPEVRTRLGAAAARHALRYDWEQSARQTWDAIRALGGHR
jgi:glycosyltransferase involved in cell wall biosynthesis